MTEIQNNTVDPLHRAHSLADSMRIECKRNRQILNSWLNLLWYFNIIFVVGAGLLTFLGGSDIALQLDIFEEPNTAGYLVLIGGALSLIHNQLGCDAHQKDCRKKHAFYKSWESEYAILSGLSNLKEIEEELANISKRRAEVEREITADAQYWFRQRMRNRVDQS